jgi:hypothetical protein
VNGYFMALTLAGADAVWAEAFPSAQQGNKLQVDTIKITPKFEEKDDSE